MSDLIFTVLKLNISFLHPLFFLILHHDSTHVVCTRHLFGGRLCVPQSSEILKYASLQLFSKFIEQRESSGRAVDAVIKSNDRNVNFPFIVRLRHTDLMCCFCLLSYAQNTVTNQISMCKLNKLNVDAVR